MHEGTPHGRQLHPAADVQRLDGYEQRLEGEIKGRVPGGAMALL